MREPRVEIVADASRLPVALAGLEVATLGGQIATGNHRVAEVGRFTPARAGRLCRLSPTGKATGPPGRR